MKELSEEIKDIVTIYMKSFRFTMITKRYYASSKLYLSERHYMEIYDKQCIHNLIPYLPEAKKMEMLLLSSQLGHDCFKKILVRDFREGKKESLMMKFINEMSKMTTEIQLKIDEIG